MQPRFRALAALLGLVVLAGIALAGAGVLKTYKKRFSKNSYLSEREEVIEELAGSGEIKALGALLWCMDVTRDRIAERQKAADKLEKKLAPVQKAYREKYEKYAAQQAKQGNPNPKRHPVWPVRVELDKLLAERRTLQRRLNEQQDLLERGLGAHGRLVAGLPEDDQTKVRTKWTEGPLVDKDWGVRAHQWELVGGVPTEWALDLLLRAAVEETDPRVLVEVVDGLGGRDPARVLSTLNGAMADVRWLVRVAAVAALERTPSKDTIDTLLAAMRSEDGRLIDDCARALTTLTGEDYGLSAERWSAWWDVHREAYAGPPEPEPEKEDPEDPVAGGGGVDPDTATSDVDAEKDPRDSETGFFGVDTRSRRLVFVIDVSGSMNEKVGEKGKKRTRAQLAKAELERAVLALEDGAMFNMVFYSSDVRVWRKTMIVASSETRLEAVEFIRESPVVGGTATYDALVAAFDLGDVGKGKKRGTDPSGDAAVDTVILLSDGRPTVGTLTETTQIRKAIVELNKARRIQVHTIALGKDADTEFMEGLATDTGGTFAVK